MYTQDELKLMQAPGMDRFPLIKVAASLQRECHTCGSHRTNPKTALIMAVNKYKNDPAFVAKCGELFKLPVYLGGCLIGGK